MTPIGRSARPPCRLVRGAISAQAMTIVRSDRWSDFFEGIEHAHGVGGFHSLADLGSGEPGEFAGFVGGVERSACGGAEEDQGHDAAFHVLVDTREALRLDRDSGLFFNLADEPRFDGFLELENASRRFPMTVVGSANGKNPPLVIEDGSGDADGMTWRG